MIGTTRSRVSFFMNRFRTLGFIDYHAGDDLRVHSPLLNIVLLSFPAQNAGMGSDLGGGKWSIHSTV